MPCPKTLRHNTRTPNLRDTKPGHDPDQDTEFFYGHRTDGGHKGTHATTRDHNLGVHVSTKNSVSWSGSCPVRTPNWLFCVRSRTPNFPGHQIFVDTRGHTVVGRVCPVSVKNSVSRGHGQGFTDTNLVRHESAPDTDRAVRWDTKYFRTPNLGCPTFFLRTWDTNRTPTHEWDKNETRLRQDWDKTETRMRQEWDKTETPNFDWHGTQDRLTPICQSDRCPARTDFQCPAWVRVRRWHKSIVSGAGQMPRKKSVCPKICVLIVSFSVRCPGSDTGHTWPGHANLVSWSDTKHLVSRSGHKTVSLVSWSDTAQTSSDTAPTRTQHDTTGHNRTQQDTEFADTDTTKFRTEFTDTAFKIWCPGIVS